jgi:endonuclease-3
MVSEKEIIKTLEIIKKSQEGIRKTTLNRESKDSKRYSPYQTLISCILSLQAKDEITEVISEELFKIAKTPQEMLKISDEKLQKIIFSSGYYRNKAKTIKHVSNELITRFDSKVPDTREELMSIKGIGPKTANIVLCFSFGKQVIPVDTHLNRIPNRLGWVKTKNPEQTEIALMEVLPKKYWMEINGLFILFGKTICLPVSPLCSKCPINKYCKKIEVTHFR